MKAIAFAFLIFLVPGNLSAQAQEPSAPPAQSQSAEERLKALEERLRALETELQALKAGQAARPAPEAAPAPALPAATAQGTPRPVSSGGAGAGANLLNPGISVIGNFLGGVGRNTVRPVPVLEMHETEIAFQAIVDPYARADFFVSLTPEGIELEEGYLTFTSLPGGVVAKVGKMRAAFGKVNALHNDGLPWTDRPLVTENLVAGEEGINDAGISLTRILPAPKNLFLEVTGQVYRGESEGLFTSDRKRDVAFVGHLRGYRDISESVNVDLGFSYARGHNDAGPGTFTQLYGADATVRWKPLRRAIYNSFLGRAEFIWSNREQAPFTQRAFGMYASGEYRMNRRWTVGGRFDFSDRPQDATLTDKGFSALLTYWPSEFSQIRGQYRFARYAEGIDANELRFQLLFNLGAHGAHPF